MPLAARTLLLITSDDAYLAALATAFEQDGYGVLTSPDGCRAITHLGAEGVTLALVILDWRAPVRDGLEFMNALAVDPRHDATPLIVLADVASTSHIPGGRVAAVVTKPVRTRWLLNVVARLASPPAANDRAVPVASVDVPTASHRRPLEVDVVELARTGRHRR